MPRWRDTRRDAIGRRAPGGRPFLGACGGAANFAPNPSPHATKFRTPEREEDGRRGIARSLCSSPLLLLLDSFPNFVVCADLPLCPVAFLRLLRWIRSQTSGLRSNSRAFRVLVIRVKLIWYAYAYGCPVLLLEICSPSLAVCTDLSYLLRSVAL
jgi:hypothetical protein